MQIGHTDFQRYLKKHLFEHRVIIRKIILHYLYTFNQQIQN